MRNTSLGLGAVALIALGVQQPATGQHVHANVGFPPDQIGTVHFETSCDPAVRP